MTNTNRADATQKISARILALVASGLTPVEACRIVLGSEAVDAMIANLYTALRG